jgi:hypothetical protein
MAAVGKAEIWAALKAAADALGREEYQMAQALMDGAGVSLPGGKKLGDCVTSSRRSQLIALCII